MAGLLVDRGLAAAPLVEGSRWSFAHGGREGGEGSPTVVGIGDGGSTETVIRTGLVCSMTEDCVLGREVDEGGRRRSSFEQSSERADRENLPAMKSWNLLLDRHMLFEGGIAGQKWRQNFRRRFAKSSRGDCEIKLAI
ncbi:chromosome segregation DNA-binding protein [Striga asiatica]|uniref:Chromosome segregation DNA-binding protein n=1 Tax=Striga asiatica TaxID=4170 RepID=A0A5A7QX70_STRAF|nr:chromosome segregation DNA-binding protein [Striga asiatica]